MFKMRPKSYDAPNYKKKMEEYYKFLEKKKRKIDIPLWQYFRNDFFHDGYVEEYFYDFDEQILKLLIGKTNHSEDDRDCFEIKYHLIFNQVSKFSVDYVEVDRTSPPSRTFMCGEIGTLENKCICKKYGPIKDQQSLIIRILNGDSIVFLSIIFGYMNVSPVEPLAYELLKQMKKIEEP